MANTHRITTPSPGHTGMVGNVSFVDGVAEIDEAVNPAELSYFNGAGYLVEELEPKSNPRGRRAAESKEAGQ